MYERLQKRIFKRWRNARRQARQAAAAQPMRPASSSAAPVSTRAPLQSMRGIRHSQSDSASTSTTTPIGPAPGPAPATAALAQPSQPRVAARAHVDPALSDFQKFVFVARKLIPARDFEGIQKVCGDIYAQCYQRKDRLLAEAQLRENLDAVSELLQHAMKASQYDMQEKLKATGPLADLYNGFTSEDMRQAGNDATQIDGPAVAFQTKLVK